MTPVLESVAPQVGGKMAIGKIDCTRHKPLCNQFDVRGFPTLKYALDGQFYDYTGGRDEKSIVAFAEKMTKPAITHIKRLEEATRFSQHKTNEGIVFLASDKLKENSKLFEIYQQVARRNQASAYFLWMEQPESHVEESKDSAYVSRVEAGVIEPKYWDMEKNELTVEALEEWIHDQNVPTIVTLGPDNFSRITKKKRPVLMGIVDTENEMLMQGIRGHIMDFVLTTPQETVEKYYYGIFDGKKWQKFLEQFKVSPKDNPQYLILDMPNKLYWRNESYTKLKDFAKAVADGSIPAMSPDKSGYGDKPFGWIIEKFVEYLPFSLAPVFILICLIVIMVTPSRDDLRPRVLNSEAGEAANEENDGGDLPAEEENKESKKDK
jgi:hypothetical protein